MTGLYTVSETDLLLPMLFTTAVTGPVVALFGTVATIWVSLQLVTLAAAAPLNRIWLVPCDEPKFAPLIVTEKFGPAVAGDTLATTGVG